MSKEKFRGKIRRVTAAAAALALAVSFTFPAGTEIMGVSFGNAIVASAETVASGDFGEGLHWEIDDEDTLTISGMGAINDFGGMPPWKDFINRIISVNIVSGVYSIGNNAFKHYSSLTSITIPNSVNSIGDRAFCDCSSLTSINIPDRVNSIGKDTFSGCTSLTSISVDVNNPNYCSVDGVLFNKDKTTLVAYPNRKGTSYVIPDSVTSIGECAFEGCSSLTSITIPDGVTSIGALAFYECTSLTSITIPSGVTSIEQSAFFGCSNLTSVTMPNSVSSIVDYAFHSCSSLTSITIPSGVSSIGSRVFYDCPRLESIFIPDSVTSIGTEAIPTSTTQIKYTISANKVTITEMPNVSEGQKVAIPEKISGYPVVSVAEVYRHYVGSHICAGGTATCTAKAVCSICGQEYGSDPDHDHSGEWQMNENEHWKICARNGCNEIIDKEAHDFDSGVVTTEPSEETEGVKTYTCETCGYEKTEPIAVLDHTHTTTEEYFSDATGHWHACSGCTEKVDFERHTEDSGTVTTEPTETTEGVKTYKCTKCEYVIRTEPIAVLDHTHKTTEEYSSDATGHWHTCSGCTEKLDLAAHTYGKWKITVPATTEANGKKERVCSVCGYVQEGTVIYGGDESTGAIDNGTNPDTNALHADLALTNEEIISKIPLTPEELDAIENGADLTVYMVVIDYSAKVSAVEKAAAESVLTGNMKIGMYIDVSLFVKVGDNAPRAVTETNGDLKITFEMPEKLINTDKNVNREYYIVRVHDSKASVLDCAYDASTGKGIFGTDRFSTYSIAYKDTPLEAPVTKYPVYNPTNGIVKTDKTSAAAGERVTVSVMPGYIAHIFGKDGNETARISGTGSFIMPAGGVKITVEYPINLALTWKNSYIYSYDSHMNKITVNRTWKQGVITVDLGREYAGRSFVIYEGKKSTSVKVTEGVLDANGKITLEVADGKNYTLVVED